jgi:hypothetical protein
MIDKNNLFVIFATLAFFAVNFLSFRSSPLLAAERPGGPTRITAALRDTGRRQAFPHRELAGG